MQEPKTEADTERQRVFCLVRHYVSSKHQVPSHLTLSDLLVILATLVGENK